MKREDFVKAAVLGAMIDLLNPNPQALV